MSGRRTRARRGARLAVSSLRDDRLARNSALLALNNVLGAVFGFVFWTVVARRLLPGEMGTLAAAVNLVPVFAVVCQLGMSELLIRRFASTGAQRSMLARMTVLSSTVAAAAAAGWLVVQSGPLHALGLRGLLLPALVVVLVASVAGNLADAALIASHRPGLLLTGTVMSSVARLAVLFAVSSAAGVFAACVAGVAVSAAFSWALVGLRVRPHRGGVWRPLRRDVRFVLSNWAAHAASQLPRGLAVAVVAARAGTETAAWVAVPLLAQPMLQMPAMVVSRTLFAEASAHPRRLPVLLRRAALLAGSLTVAVAAFAAWLAPVVLAVFGARYSHESTVLLRMGALAAVCSAGNYLVDVSLNVRGNPARFLGTNLFGVAANVGLLYVLAPFGVTGVGVAWVAGQAAYLAVGLALHVGAMPARLLPD